MMGVSLCRAAASLQPQQARNTGFTANPHPATLLQTAHQHTGHQAGAGKGFYWKNGLSLVWTGELQIHNFPPPSMYQQVLLRLYRVRPPGQENCNPPVNHRSLAFNCQIEAELQSQLSCAAGAFRPTAHLVNSALIRPHLMSFHSSLEALEQICPLFFLRLMSFFMKWTGFALN